jgi:hypothetical protein
MDLILGGAIDLVDHDDVGHAQIRFTGVVAVSVSCAERIDDHDRQVRPAETT